MGSQTGRESKANRGRDLPVGLARLQSFSKTWRGVKCSDAKGTFSSACFLRIPKSRHAMAGRGLGGFILLNGYIFNARRVLNSGEENRHLGRLGRDSEVAALSP